MTLINMALFIGCGALTLGVAISCIRAAIGKGH